VGFSVDISVKIDSNLVAKSLEDVARSDVRFVLASGVTKVGQAVQARFKSRLPQVFDRPTPFTQRGVYLERAEKSRPVATVYFPDSAENRGKDTREYIRPGAEGATARHQKKTEFLLSRAGFLPPGWVTVPGSFFKAGRLDQYGNISGAYYKQIIRSLMIKNTKGPARPASAASRARAAKMGVESEFFAVSTGANKLGRNGGWLPSGVYRRSGLGGRKLVQYLQFVRRAAYRKRFDVQVEAQAAVNASAPAAFAEAVQSVTQKFRTR
jgi:hypothetical protein